MQIDVNTEDKLLISIKNKFPRKKEKSSTMFQVRAKPYSENLLMKYSQYIPFSCSVLRFFGRVPSGRVVKERFHNPTQLIFVSTTLTQIWIHDNKFVPKGTSL